MAKVYFEYGEKEILYLKQRDKLLGEAIDKIGPIERDAGGDLFVSVVNNIVGQQISGAAQTAIWNRMLAALGEITPTTICDTSVDQLQANGISFRKAEYIKTFAANVDNGTLDIDSLYNKTDAEIITELTAIKGIGEWTAEMLMLFSMQRGDILSFGDLAIHRGMRMLYHHRNIDRKLFEKYRRRYSPYGSVASLYLWHISGGAISGMKDYAPKKKKP